MTSADNNKNGHAGCRARSNYVRHHLRATGREMNVNSNIATVSPPVDHRSKYRTGLQIFQLCKSRHGIHHAGRALAPKKHPQPTAFPLLINYTRTGQPTTRADRLLIGQYGREAGVQADLQTN